MNDAIVWPMVRDAAVMLVLCLMLMRLTLMGPR